MSEKRVYIPPEYAETDMPIIFLAGPIQGTSDWQTHAIEIIHSLGPDAQIASPRRPIFDRDEDYSVQINWETHHLRNAASNGVIMFWLAKETEHNPERAYAQTSRAELFEWKVRHERDKVKLVVGIEDGFSGARYIRHRFSQDCPDVPILDSLEETCRTIFEILQAMAPETKAGSANPDKEERLRKEIDALIPQVFPNLETKNSLRFANLGDNWTQYMPNVHRLFPDIYNTSPLALNPNFFPVYKLWVSFGSMDVTFAYYKNGRTEVKVGTDEWDKEFKMMVRKTKTDDEESGEEIRLKMIKEVLEFTLARKKFDLREQ